MSDKSSADLAAQKRIVEHMNADHHDSIVRILRHHHNLSSPLAYDGTMTDISLSKMKITCSKSQYTISFDPPMPSYKDARTRLVEMDQQACRALNVSGITISHFLPLARRNILFCVFVVVVVVSFWSRDNFGDASSENFTACDSGISGVLSSNNGCGRLGTYLPNGFRWLCWTVQPVLVPGMFVIHLLETVWFVYDRLARYNVNVRTKAFWYWTLDCFVEGIGCFKRFDALTARLEAEKAARKH